MDLVTKLRYKVINLGHLRRCMYSKFNYQISSISKKQYPVPMINLVSASNTENGNTFHPLPHKATFMQ